MSEFYVFTTEQEAIDAVAFIDQAGNLPRRGVNARTKQPADPTKQQTTTYAVPMERLDGKWVFPRVPEEDRGNGQLVAAFNAQFSYALEEYDSGWFPQVV